MAPVTRARSADDFTLPEVEEIINQDAELRQILVDIARRQAGGASKSGRYNKHDTARLRFVRDKALVDVRRGKLVDETDTCGCCGCRRRKRCASAAGGCFAD